MSLAASQARLIMITRYRSDLEYGMNMIMQEREDVAYKAQQCSEDPDAVAYFHDQDKQLELEMSQLDTQLKLQNSEYESVKKMVDDGAKRAGQYA